jgi:ribosomal-protein-alanine N-acetyltransferase
VRATNLRVLEFYDRCGYTLEDRASLGKRLNVSTSFPTDPVPEINVSDTIYLSQITWDDKPAYLRYLNETDAFRNNGIQAQFPYTEFDADRWISAVTSETLPHSHRRIWAIRGACGELIGAFGLSEIKTDDRATCGYWLAKPFWGQGIMTQVVRRMTTFAFMEYHLRRLQACVFSINQASARVLTKAGFRLEGILRSRSMSNGQPVDDLIFGLLKDELPEEPTV